MSRQRCLSTLPGIRDSIKQDMMQQLLGSSGAPARPSILHHRFFVDLRCAEVEVGSAVQSWQQPMAMAEAQRFPTQLLSLKNTLSVGLGAVHLAARAGHDEACEE